MRKKILFLSLFCILQSTFIYAQEAETGRVSQLFNFGWRFHFGDLKNAQSVDCDDTAWRTLDLPHDFQIEQPWEQSAGGARGFKAMGTGWYRKAFFADSLWKNRRVILDFEGIIYLGDVWINGVLVGGTEYGYNGFEVDITQHLRFGQENIVAVQASTGRKNGSRWYTGGGIFRDVHLVVKDKIAVARHGVYITTPRISNDEADIQVQVELEGIRNRSFDIDIIAKIYAPNGHLITKNKIAAPKRNKLYHPEIKLPLVTIENPQLWSCEKPNLYRAEVVLIKNGKVIDNVDETFGIRTLEFSPKFGFKLNGKKIFLKGISNHHDLGAVGVAAFDAAIERQFKLMKKFGYNHIRCSHNPYSTGFLKLADKYGILVVDELIDKWSDRNYWGGRKPFTSIWHEMITEWIKRDRNHPCVILWSLGNELQMREDLAGFPTGDWGVTTYRIFDVLVKRYDSTRKTTVAMFPARQGAIGKKDPDFDAKIFPPELATITEVSSFNYRYSNYRQYLQATPHMIMYQSEATTHELVAPYYGMDQEKMVGLAYWGAIEYWGESDGWPKKGWNYSFFSHTLEPYPQAFLIKSAFCDEPLVHIGVVDSPKESIEWNDVVVGRMPVSSHWNHAENSKQNLFTYTNADEVELLVNGKSIGIQRNNRSDINRRNMIYWQDVSYGTGGTLTAIARSQGREVARHTLHTTGKAIRLKAIVEDEGDFHADGMDLQYVKVYALDSKGRNVPVSGNNVTFEVEGEARLIAVDNGDHYTDELFNVNHKKLYNGFVMAILRSTQKPGDINLKITAEKLKGVKLKMKSK